MEYCEGGSLETLIRGKSMSEAVARRIFQQIGIQTKIICFTENFS
jgi:hypothetical protein